MRYNIFLSKRNSNARPQNICTSFTGVVHGYEITLKSAVFQSVGVARGSCKVFYALCSLWCWFVCFISWMKYFFTYLTKLEFLTFFMQVISADTVFSYLSVQQMSDLFYCCVFSLSCWTTCRWPEGSLHVWYSNKLIQWVVMLEISRATLASSLVLSLLFSYPHGDDLLMAANG